MAEGRIGCLGATAIVVGLIVAFSALRPSGNDPAAVTLANRALSRVGHEIAWDRVEIETARSDDYTLKLVYRAPGPDNPAVPNLDTKKIARALLNELVMIGRRPANEHMTVWVWAQVPAGTGETGQPLVRVYGHTEYDPGTDRLEFKPWKP
jgi:hypothetical protein